MSRPKSDAAASATVAVDAVFSALADGTRRDLLDELAGDGDASASALARRLPVSRQAIARHLQILADAGLVAAARRGRERCYSVRPRALLATARWMERAAQRWEDDRRRTGPSAVDL